MLRYCLQSCLKPVAYNRCIVRYASDQVVARPAKVRKQGGVRQSQASRARGNLKVVACATAEEYDMQSLQRALLDHDLIATGTAKDALTIAGEAIYLPRVGSGEAFLFEEGSSIFFGVEEDEMKNFVNKLVGSKGVQVGPYQQGAQEEDMYVVLRDGPGPTTIKGDLISMPRNAADETKIEDDEELRIALVPKPGQLPSNIAADLPDPNACGLPISRDALLSRLALGAALMKSTKLSVHEVQLDALLEQVSEIPKLLQTPLYRLPPKKDILATAGKLLEIRQQLNLVDSNLLDPPNFLWETSQAIENLYLQMSSAMDLEKRLETLNLKIDYAENQNEKLLELKSTQKSHTLEWIIIVLIAAEIALTLSREGLFGREYDYKTEQKEV